MNRFSAATFPVSLWISLVVFGGYISKIALILSGFASMPLYETIKPRNLPE
jgi:hypothetical protein